MYKKIIAIILSVLIAALAFAGCGSKTKQTSADVRNGLSAYEIAVKNGYKGQKLNGWRLW